jgi:hypothetical protein
MNGFIDSGGATPPLLFETLRGKDLETLDAQMKGRAFDVTIVRGIARRCPWGFPQVIVCGPLRKARPFPTTFWLTCPFLDRTCGQLESEGAVGELEGILARPGVEKSWAAYNEKAARLRRRLLSGEERDVLLASAPAILENVESVGVGGIRPGEKPSVKCIHLQVATWLGLGYHPAGEWLAGKLARLDCAGSWRIRCEPPISPKEGL